MTKHTNFEMAVSRVERLTTNEKIALMKHISALLGGPRFFTVEEVRQLNLEAIQQFVNDINERNQPKNGILTIDTRGIH